MHSRICVGVCTLLMIGRKTMLNGMRNTIMSRRNLLRTLRIIGGSLECWRMHTTNDSRRLYILEDV
eukprot:3726009-Ditylum_brightwellii.AAC.2